MDVKKIVKNLTKEISKVQKIKKDLQKTFSEQKILDNDLKKIVEKDVVENNYPKKREFTNEELQKLKNIKKIMHNDFKKSILNEISGEDNREEQFKPITNALKRVESAVKEVDIKSLVPFSTKKSIGYQSTKKESGTQTPPVTSFGEIASTYLHRKFEKSFGVYYDFDKKQYKIGKDTIKIQDNDIFINGRWIPGTNGLWNLLTSSSSEPPQKNDYTDNDLKTYQNILIETEALYQNNDKNTAKPKSSSGAKYTVLIKPLWNQIKHKSVQRIIDESTPNRTLDWDNGYLAPYSPLFDTPKRGEGIKKYSENPVEYKYVENLNELLKRLYFIASEEKAGNNNFYNEKRGILHFFTRELEKLLDSQNGTEILISFVSRLPKKVVGSGLINDFINKLPFEMHWPGYNYLGPGTKLDKRLERGDKPINKLDEAAKDHDIFYKNHKDTKTRHKADEVLEYKAWDRVLDPNANLNEKTAAWVTSNAMKLKRHLGMGLK